MSLPNHKKHKINFPLYKCVKPPHINCKECWFLFFEARPGLVLAVLSLIKKIVELKSGGVIDNDTAGMVKKFLISGMGCKFAKFWQKYYDEVYKVKYAQAEDKKS